jgi:hypothetical protein
MRIFIVFVEHEFEILARDTDVYCLQFSCLITTLGVVVQCKVTKSFEQDVGGKRCDELALSHRTSWVDIHTT